MQRLGSKEEWVPYYVEGSRKTPLYYRLENIVVLGTYENVNGGCDTIGSAPKIFNVLKSIEFAVAITEGILWSCDVKWTTQLDDVRAIFLATSTEDCYSRILQRRGKRKLLNATRIQAKLEHRAKEVERARERLLEKGVYCRQTSSKQAPGLILRWLWGRKGLISPVIASRIAFNQEWDV
jgi:hypothetical protein